MGLKVRFGGRFGPMQVIFGAAGLVGLIAFLATWNWAALLLAAIPAVIAVLTATAVFPQIQQDERAEPYGEQRPNDPPW